MSEIQRADDFEFQPVKRRAKLHDQVLTKAEWGQMTQLGDYKDKAILALGVLGLRASEIAACSADWIDAGDRLIQIPSTHAKRGKPRRVYFDFDPVRSIVLSYFAIEPAIGISRQAIWQRIKKLRERANIAKPLTVHGLRATGATWAANAGMSAQAIREMFGWANLQDAERYIQASSRTAERELREKGGYF